MSNILLLHGICAWHLAVGWNIILWHSICAWKLGVGTFNGVGVCTDVMWVSVLMCHDVWRTSHIARTSPNSLLFLHSINTTLIEQYCCSTDMGGLYIPSIDHLGMFYIRGLPFMVSPSVNGVHPGYFMLIGGRVLKNRGKGLILIFNSCLHPLYEFITGVYVVF